MRGDPFDIGPWQARLNVQGPAGDRRESADLVAVLRGVLYDQDLDGALTLYRQHGDSFARQLEGSYTLLLLDRRAERVLVVTDRLSSRKVFALQDAGRVCLSTHPDAAEFTRRPISLGAVGSCLANGHMANGLTPYDGVRSLAPAALHEALPSGVRRHPYWSLTFGPGDLARSAEDYAEELLGLLRRSVARRLSACGSRPFLSLSGGYDSRGLLSLLAGHGTLQTFSYTLASSAESDAGVAAQLAAQYGTRHHSLTAYRGDLPGAIRLNAHRGQGVAAYCEEIDAWQELEAQQPTDIFTGEQTFELQAQPLLAPADRLARVRVNTLRSALWLAPSLQRGVFGALEECWGRDYEELLASSRAHADPYHGEEQLMVSQYEPYRLLPWRERFGGEANLHYPYLDTGVLEFIGRLPTPLLAGKKILKLAMRQMDPALFRVPLARSQGYEADWQLELMRHGDLIGEELLSRPSRFDEIIDPTALRRLIAELRSPSPREAALSSLRSVLGRLRRSPGGRRVFGHPPYRPRVPSRPLQLLELLTLRELFRVPQSADGSDAR